MDFEIRDDYKILSDLYFDIKLSGMIENNAYIGISTERNGADLTVKGRGWTLKSDIENNVIHVYKLTFGGEVFAHYTSDDVDETGRFYYDIAIDEIKLQIYREVMDTLKFWNTSGEKSNGSIYNFLRGVDCANEIQIIRRNRVDQTGKPANIWNE